MRIAILAASAAAVFAFAAPAQAQDSEKGFTGPRVEGVVGWDRVDSGSASGVPATDGVVGGVNAGYDFDLGNVVIGAEGEATWATTDEEAAGVVVPGDSLRVGAGRDLYAGARVGFKAGSRALIYAKGGYTNARVNTTYTSGASTTRTGENADGWRAGAGVEYKLTGNVYAKAEYRYSNYGNLNGTNIDIDRHQVVGGLGVRF